MAGTREIAIDCQAEPPPLEAIARLRKQRQPERAIDAYPRYGGSRSLCVRGRAIAQEAAMAQKACALNMPYKYPDAVVMIADAMPSAPVP